MRYLYVSYFGIEKIKVCVRIVVYWIGMNWDIIDMIVKCYICIDMRNKNLKELLNLMLVLEGLW